VLIDLDFPFLGQAEYVGSVRQGRKIFVFIRGIEASLQELARLSSELSRRLRSTVRVLLDHHSFNTFMATLLAPAKILSMNVVWLPDGSEETIVVVDDPERSTLEVEDVVRLVKEFKGRVVRVERAGLRR